MCETNLKDTLFIQVVSTWDVGNERKIEDSINVNSGLLAVETDCGSNVSFETCVHLVSQKNVSSPCELRITIPQAHRDMKIMQMCVLSEARVIELYGCYGEYLSTMEGTFIDEYEEMPVYKAEAKLSQPSYECSLKFVRSKRKLDMWLYGINICLQKNEAIHHPDTPINFQIVNKILKESGHQLTEKAEKCKKFLQIYRSTSDASKPKMLNKPDLQTLMKMFESKYLRKYNPYDSGDKNVPNLKCITGTGELSSKQPSNVGFSSGEAQDTHTECVVSQPLEDVNFKNEVKQHVEQCFHELEVQLMARIEEKLSELEKRQNEKFDIILLEIEKLQQHIGGVTNKSL